jgi:hypothetical protein
MLNPAARRLILLVLGLALAALACARAEVPITPATPLAASPIVAAQITPAESQPTIEASPTATLEPSPASEGEAPTPGPTDTPLIAPPPTDTPLPATETPIASDTPPPTETAVPTDTPFPSPTQPGPTDTPAPLPTIGANPGGIPENATFTQQFTVSNEGGAVFGRPQDMGDGRTETWASLRGGGAAWVFNLGSPQNVIGLSVWAQPDRGEETSLVSIEVSADGASWTAVYAGDGTCGDVPQCDFLQQREFVDFGFGPLTAQYVRLRGGPTRFAFAEVKIALAP